MSTVLTNSSTCNVWMKGNWCKGLLPPIHKCKESQKDVFRYIRATAWSLPPEPIIRVHYYYHYHYYPADSQIVCTTSIHIHDQRWELRTQAEGKNTTWNFSTTTSPRWIHSAQKFYCLGILSHNVVSTRVDGVRAWQHFTRCHNQVFVGICLMEELRDFFPAWTVVKTIHLISVLDQEANLVTKETKITNVTVGWHCLVHARDLQVALYCPLYA